MPVAGEPPRRSPAKWIALGLLLVIIGGLGFAAYKYRVQIVSFWPKTDALYETLGIDVNVSGLDLVNVSYDRTFEDGVPVLEIRGEVANATDIVKDVRRLRAVLRDGQEKELYCWTFSAEATTLGPRQTTSFVSRLTSPPTESADLIVSFGEKCSG